MPAGLALILLSPAVFGPTANGLVSPQVGVPEDWSHHHVIFSAPSTPEEALRLRKDPRYIHQLARRAPDMRRSPSVLINEPERGDNGETAHNAVFGPRPVGSPPGRRGLWGQALSSGDSSWASPGPGVYPAKFGFVDTATVNCGNATAPDYVVYGLQSGTVSTQTGSYTGNPANGQTVTIGGTLVLTASASAAATGTVTLTNEPGFQDTIQIGSTTYIWQSQATSAATGTIVLSSEPAVQDTVKVGSITYIWEPPTSTATGVVTISNEPANGDQVRVGSTTYTWQTSCTGINFCVVRATQTATDAANLANAINGSCGGNSCSANSSASAAPAMSTVKLTARTAGSAGNFTLTVPVNAAGNSVSGGNNGVNGCLGVNNCVVLDPSINAAATNLANAINGSCGGNSCAGNSSASAAASMSTVNLTARTQGAAGDFALSLPVNAAGNSASGGNNGTNSCSGVNYCIIMSASTTTDAVNLKNALGGNCGGNTCAPNSSVTATSSGHTVSLTATTPGSGGDFALTLPVNSAGNSVAGGNNATDGVNAGTSFQTGVSTVADAGNLAAAIARNGGAVGVTASSSNATVIVKSLIGGAITLATNQAGFSWTAGTIPGTLTGGSSTQATVVAYDNLYTSCSGTVPSVYWSYNTSTGTVRNAQAVSSPVISADGAQVAFVETSGSTAYLVILKWKSGQGTSASAPVTPGTQTTSGAAYASCRSTSASCQLTLSLGANDTNSSPFVDYTNDVLYVGDSSGILHQVTGVFKGTPIFDTTHPGWPVTVDGGAALGSPVYDSASGLVFVGDANGKLSSVASGAHPAVHNSAKIEFISGGIGDAPLVNSTTELVYVFVSCDAACSPTSSNGVFRFAASFTSGSGTEQPLTQTGAALTSQKMYAGTFDNTYYAGSGSTGQMYTCGYANGAHPILYQIPMSFAWGSAPVTTTNLTGGPGGCSPLTENLSGIANSDGLFLSVTANGNQPGCTGDCIYSFNIFSGSPVLSAARQATAGASGMIIDNSANTTGASQIYYATQGASTNRDGYSCPSPSGGTGVAATAGGCAVQASQAALE